MNVLLIGILSVTVVGIICAVVLSVASKLMYVHVDERIDQVRDCLPGANCGACGYAGCDGYAAAVVADESVSLSLCTPGGNDVVKSIGAVLGREGGVVEPKIAVIRCKGDHSVTSDKMIYEGIEGCTAAKLLFGGVGKCTFGCMGLGDCVKICPHQAIYLKNGIAHVDPGLCIGCGICEKACPNHLIAILPESAKTQVLCSNMEKGAAVRKSCSAGCIGCGKCAKVCPSNAVVIKNNLAYVDHKKCVNCGNCRDACPMHCFDK